MVCLNHPDREASYRCAACGKPVCNECAFEYEGDFYCSADCAEKGSESKARSSFIMAATAESKKKARKKGIVFCIILVIAAAIAAYFYSQNKEEIDKTINSHIDVVSDTVGAVKDSAVNTGHSSVPKDSKYRRQRNEIIGNK